MNFGLHNALFTLFGSFLYRSMSPRDQARFRLLKAIEANPDVTQRELAIAVGVSLGRTNYLIKALVEKGLVKIGNFTRNEGKLTKISYLLTPEGVRDRAALTAKYLERKKLEYELLRREIEILESERASVQNNHPASSGR